MSNDQRNLYLGAVADLETAVYFSTVTYAAIGFGRRIVVTPAYHVRSDR